MYCMYCGASNSEGNRFCISCGKPLEASAAGKAQPGGAVSPGKTVGVGAQSAAAVDGGHARNADGVQNASVAEAPYVAGARYEAQNAASADAVYASQAYDDNQAYRGQPGATTAYAAAAAPQPQVKPKGCFSLAWEDVRNSKGWLPKAFLMGLILLVPVLNFFVLGYVALWGAEAARGENKSMPKSIFGNGGFKRGFFVFAFGLIAGLLEFFASWPLAFIPFFGLIADIALGIFVAMFASLCVMRIALSDRFSEGFSISAVWDAFRRDAGGLFCASYLPSIVMCSYSSVKGNSPFR